MFGCRFYILLLMFTLSWLKQGMASHWDVVEPTYKTESQIPLSLVILDTSEWSKLEVLERVRRVEKIYKSCSVSFSPIRIMTLNRPDLATFSYSDYEDIELLEKLNIKERPLVFFGNKNTSPFGFDAYTWIEQQEVAKVRKRVSFVFSSWKRTERNLKIFDNIITYSVLAHELGHTLLNMTGHNELAENVMGKKSAPMGDQFTEAQCAKIRKFSVR